MLLISFLVLGLAVVVYRSVKSYVTENGLDDDGEIKQVFYSQGEGEHNKYKQEAWDTVGRNLWRDPELYLSIVVPAFNEEDRILKTLDSMVYYMEQRSRQNPAFRYEIILVDDGGSDDTLRVCEGFWRGKMAKNEVPGGQLRLISSIENRGKGNAVRLGVMASLGEYILMADADGATKIECLSRMEEAILSRGEQLQIVFGSRSTKDSLYDSDTGSADSKIERAWYRQILNTLFHKITKVIINSNLNDTQCGFKLFSRRSARTIFPSLHIKRWAFDIEIVVIAQIANLEIQPVNVDWREVEGSKLSVLSDSAKMLLDIVILKSFYVLGVWSVKEHHRPERASRGTTETCRKTS
ncbi:Alg5 like dolichyl-phosphate beta-glucosyltransferase [Cryptosporidium canis]|nr:Alg5 like dolichyl-phosphate beta-glucosyltransferase [Cryptosporidium canis]